MKTIIKLCIVSAALLPMVSLASLPTPTVAKAYQIASTIAKQEAKEMPSLNVANETQKLMGDLLSPQQVNACDCKVDGKPGYMVHGMGRYSHCTSC